MISDKSKKTDYFHQPIEDPPSQLGMANGNPFYVLSSTDLLNIPKGSTSVYLIANHSHPPIIKTVKDCSLLPIDTLDFFYIYGEVGEDAQEELLNRIYDSSTLSFIGFEDTSVNLSCFKLLVAGKTSNSLTEIEIEYDCSFLSDKFAAELGRGLNFTTGLQNLRVKFPSSIKDGYSKLFFSSWE